MTSECHSVHPIDKHTQSYLQIFTSKLQDCRTESENKRKIEKSSGLNIA